MGRRGPQPKQINWDEFDKLVALQATQEEIAAWFDTSWDTLARACERDRGEKLADIWDKRVFSGRLKLRKMQMKIVEKCGQGSSTMAIFLGKQMLGQADQPAPPPTTDEPEPDQVLTFETFCTNAGYPKPFRKQIEMYDFAFGESDPRMVLGARGYGKTDYITAAGTAWDIYKNPLTTTNLIISKSKTRNSALIGEIAHCLKSNGIELEKHNSSCIRVKGLVGKDHSAEALTIKSSFRGRHPKRILMDDPVTEEDTSDAMRKLVKTKYDEAFKLCSNICIIGQPAHRFDLYAKLKDSIKVMRVPHGTIPQLDADLEAMALAGVEPNSIEMSYHLNVPEDSTSIFSNLKFIDEMPEGNTVAYIDPSDGGDYTAMSIVRGYGDGFAVFGKAYKKAWYHCIDDLAKQMQKNGVTRLCFETNATGNQPIVQLREALQKFGIGVVGKFSTTNKHSMIMACGSYSHLIHLAKTSDKVYTDQVVQYEYGSKHDDAPDSLARCLEWLGVLKGR